MEMAGHGMEGSAWTGHMQLAYAAGKIALLVGHNIGHGPAETDIIYTLRRSRTEYNILVSTEDAWQVRRRRQALIGRRGILAQSLRPRSGLST